MRRRSSLAHAAVAVVLPMAPDRGLALLPAIAIGAQYSALLSSVSPADGSDGVENRNSRARRPLVNRQTTKTKMQQQWCWGARAHSATGREIRWGVCGFLPPEVCPWKRLPGRSALGLAHICSPHRVRDHISWQFGDGGDE